MINYIAFLPILILGDCYSTFYDGSYCEENQCTLLTATANCCSTEPMERYNSVSIHEIISDIVRRNYFRYYKVNLHRDCQFWPEEKMCALKNCNIDSCSQGELPPAYRGNENVDDSCSIGLDINLHSLHTEFSQEELDLIKTIGWQDKPIEFIDLNDFLEDPQYYDLINNPERYTGYAGKGSARIWHAIFEENCLKSKGTSKRPGQSGSSETCIEFEIFQRILSGFRSSVAVHASSIYPVENNKFRSVWGISFEQLEKRFSPDRTGGLGTTWLHDLIFDYSILHRAIVKSEPLWRSLVIDTGAPEDDAYAKALMLDLMQQLKLAPGTFREQVMFVNNETSAELVNTIQTTFKNISRILDCVACDRCRLWSKVQILGFATALKILFTPSNKLIRTVISPAVELNRMEVVPLFNLFSKLSASLHFLHKWRLHVERSSPHSDL